MQKGNDRFYVAVRQIAAELAAPHDAHERIRATVMEIRCGDADIAKARNAEDMAVPFEPGDGVAPEVAALSNPPAGERIGEDAEFLKQVAADIRALMAGGAAVVLEEGGYSRDVPPR